MNIDKDFEAMLSSADPKIQQYVAALTVYNRNLVEGIRMAKEELKISDLRIDDLKAGRNRSSEELMTDSQLQELIRRAQSGDESADVIVPEEPESLEDIADPQILRFVSALRAENVRLEKKLAKLRARLITENNRILDLENTLNRHSSDV